VSPLEIEKLLLEAAEIGGWKLLRRRSHRTSAYFDFSHPHRRAVTVRISDHPAVERERQKLLCVHRSRPKTVWGVVRFLKKQGGPAFTMPQRRWR
jgi:hypothetical protein